MKKGIKGTPWWHGRSLYTFHLLSGDQKTPSWSRAKAVPSGLKRRLEHARRKGLFAQAFACLREQPDGTWTGRDVETGELVNISSATNRPALAPWERSSPAHAEQNV